MTVEILSMYNLTPMRVTYRKDELEPQGVTVFVDFYNEKIHWEGNLKPPVELQDAIKKIISDKKEHAENVQIPESVIDEALSLKGKGKNARKHKHEDWRPQS